MVVLVSIVIVVVVVVAIVIDVLIAIVIDVLFVIVPFQFVVVSSPFQIQIFSLPRDRWNVAQRFEIRHQIGQQKSKR